MSAEIAVQRVQPKGLYAYFCRELALKPNSAVLQMLEGVCLLCDADEQHHSHDDDATPIVGPSSTKVDRSPLRCAGPTTIDLSLNLLGCEGLRPLLQTVRVVHHFTSIDLSNNVLDSRATGELVKYLDGVTSITSIRLSNNKLISQLGGRYIKSFVAQNANVSHMFVDGTSISSALAKVISELCARNEELQKNPTLFEEKMVWQRKLRLSAHTSSTQPTPIKRMNEGSSAQRTEGSLPQGDASVVTGSSDDNATLLVGQSSTAAVLLPPFQHANIDDSVLNPPTGGYFSSGEETDPLQFVFAVGLRQDGSVERDVEPLHALKLLQEIMFE